MGKMNYKKLKKVFLLGNMLVYEIVNRKTDQWIIKSCKTDERIR